MSSIVLTSAVRTNLLALQATASSLATTQNNLSTGKKVNSALDNPTNFFTASGLDNRANDISDLLDGISNGVQVIQAANTGLTSIQSLVSQAKSIANQALQTSIGYSTKSSFTSSAVTGATSDNLLGATTYAAGAYTGGAAANAKTSTTTSTATKLSGGSTTVDGLTTALTSSDSLVVDGKTISFNSGSGTSTSSSGASIDITTGTVADVLTAINSITGSNTAAVDATTGKITLTSGTTSELTVTGSSNALSSLGLNAGTGTGSSSAVTGISSSSTKSLNGTSATTALPAGSTLQIASTAKGTATNITFGTGAGQVSTLTQLNSALAANNLQATLDSTTGKITIATTNDAASSTIGAVTVSGTGNAFSAVPNPPAPVADATAQTTRANLVSQYNAILDQIDNTASDSSYNGVNLLAGDQLSLTFNETGKSKVNITGVNASSAGLGLSKLTSGTDFIDNTATNKVLTNLSTVSTTLRSQASTFGSNLSVVQTRQDFNKNLINVLQTGSANLTQADINEEAANSQALTTRQSLSVSALSLANTAQQSVLQLLR